jgi:hypothetical protein
MEEYRSRWIITAEALLIFANSQEEAKQWVQNLSAPSDPDGAQLTPMPKVLAVTRAQDVMGFDPRSCLYAVMDGTRLHNDGAEVGRAWATWRRKMRRYGSRGHNIARYEYLRAENDDTFRTGA